MGVAQFTNLIPQNIALKDAVRIGVYNSKGSKIAHFGLQHLTPPQGGEKLYSFGAVSDVHMLLATDSYDNTSFGDFERALRYLNGTVDFICVAGDLTDNGKEEQLHAFKRHVDTYAPDIPTYAITGNHELYDNLDIESVIASFTGHPLYYTFARGDDVFIMQGIKGESALFTDAQLQWLYETLEENRNRRCFVFMHVFPGKGKTPACGNADGIYQNDCWSNATQTAVFESLMEHYVNTIFFHGHSHLRFGLQSEKCPYANYSGSSGYHSVHIPSVAVPRDDADLDGEAEVFFAGGEGYIVDVYEKGIMLRGRDFVKGEFLPIATYWLDTGIKMVEASTYVDKTGTIDTNTSIK